MSPCECLETFVHTKCALLHYYELVRQVCPNCKMYKMDRIICRSRTPSPERCSDENELHRMNQRIGYPLDQPLFERRLGVDFEVNCHICQDGREQRIDKFEDLDSKIIRACQCRVTAHNECIVESLLASRECGYCGYRIRFEKVG
uniref:RING-type domain-containing protein n=1 Tax=Caenorhabditis japonica TaxID=281687 RepID=A0A8R1IIA9_CAEJA